MKSKVLQEIVLGVEQIPNSDLITCLILFGSYLMRSEDASDIDIAVVMERGQSSHAAIKTLNGLTSEVDGIIDVSLIYADEVVKDFYFGNHGYYLQQTLARGHTLYGKNPFEEYLEVPINELRLKQSIVVRCRDYVYELRKSYFDDRAQMVVDKRYNKTIRLFAFLLIDELSLDNAWRSNSNELISQLMRRYSLEGASKRQILECLWKEIQDTY